MTTFVVSIVPTQPNCALVISYIIDGLNVIFFSQSRSYKWVEFLGILTFDVSKLAKRVLLSIAMCSALTDLQQKSLQKKSLTKRFLRKKSLPK